MQQHYFRWVVVIQFICFLFASPIIAQQVDWVNETGLSLGAKFIDGAVYSNFAGTGLDVRINVNIVSGDPSIDGADPTAVYIKNAANASMTVTFLNGTADVVLRNVGNLLAAETVVVSNPDGKNITVTEISNNGGAAMTVDGISMPTGGSPNFVTGDDSVIITEKSSGAGTTHDVSMDDVTGFTWLYATAGAKEGFQLTLNGIVLPIELASFKTILLPDEKVQLDWTTVSETNNDYFTVERSKNGYSWLPIANVDGNGTITSENSYRFIDTEPYTHLSYYRLKQTDYDGKFSYSSVSSIRIEHKDDINIYPNPTTNHVTVSNLNSNEVVITDLLGNVLDNLVLKNSINESLLELDLSNLPSGVYFVKTPTTVHRIFKE